MNEPPHSAMPAGYADLLRQARSTRAMHGERRIITMLFCDVTGSTAMAEKLDAEEWAEIITEAFQYMMAPVYLYEGTVARLMGDAVLAFFGAPIAHEDDPQRAVLAGLGIVRGIADFSAEIREIYGQDFNVRVGINTGPVVVGEIGSDLAVEYTALGDAVNLAARMEQTAEPGTVQISEHTYRLVAPFFDFTPLGQIEVKGKEQPVPSYRVEGVRSDPGSLRGIEGLSSPLVGRDEEFSVLLDAVEAIKRDGQGRIIFLIGEAGLGKSRMIAELHDHWRETVAPDEHGWTFWDEMTSASFSASQPYGLIKHQLRMRCGITEGDPPETARRKLAHTISIYPPELQERLKRLFAILLGIGEQQLAASEQGEAYQRDLFDAILQATAYRAAGRPTVLVAEDIHWSDPASVAELEHLLALGDDSPFLFIAAMRPETGSPAWAMKERVTERYPARTAEITLRALSSAESARMVDQLLPVAGMPVEVRETILQRTDGNPFFIEEVIRAMLDDNLLQRQDGGLVWNADSWSAEVSIPTNVQALLAARIDRLQEDTRHTLQLASVIGRSFYHRVLEAISEAAEAMDEQLQELEALSFISEAAQLPELEYAFRHALTRDAAYATILRRRRRYFHRRVAEAFETLFPDRLEDEAHRLAEHFKQALVMDKAQHYYTMAGDQALRLFAKDEAVLHFRQALEIARESGGDDDLLGIYLRLLRAYEISGRYDDSLESVVLMREDAEERQNKAFELQALLAEATLRNTFTDKYDPQLGSALAHEALLLAQEMGDPRAESRANWNLLLMGTYTGTDIDQTTAFGERAVEIARRHGFRVELAYALHDLARPYVMAGRLKDGEQALEEAADLFRELGRTNMLADNRTTLAENLTLQGRLSEALERAQEAEQLSRREGNDWGLSYALGICSPLLIEFGQIDAAFAAWQESLEAAQRANFTAPEIYIRAQLAINLARLGDSQGAFEVFDQVEALGQEYKISVFAAIPDFGRAYLHILDGNLEEAQAHFPGDEATLVLAQSEPGLYSMMASTSVLLPLHLGQYEQALEHADHMIAEALQNEVTLMLPQLSELRARALMGLGRNEEAAQLLAKAAQRARTFGARMTLLSILAAQITLGRRTDQAQLVGAATAEAREIVADFSSHINDAGLREHFLHIPAVREVGP